MEIGLWFLIGLILLFAGVAALRRGRRFLASGLIIAALLLVPFLVIYG